MAILTVGFSIVHGQVAGQALASKSNIPATVTHAATRAFLGWPEFLVCKFQQGLFLIVKINSERQSLVAMVDPAHAYIAGTFEIGPFFTLAAIFKMTDALGACF